jgi:hypothetical protein
MMHFPPQQRGFTLLLAALVASIVLSLGSSIFLIAQKQVTLSSLGRDSQFAFYAADAAAECALYWDLRYSYFSTTTANVTLSCDGKREGTDFTVSGLEATPPYTVEFKLNFYVNADGVPNTSDDQGYCADVTVKKDTVNPFTVIHADGYSVPCEAIDASARALQRSVELHY